MSMQKNAELSPTPPSPRRPHLGRDLNCPTGWGAIGQGTGGEGGAGGRRGRGERESDRQSAALRGGGVNPGAFRDDPRTFFFKPRASSPLYPSCMMHQGPVPCTSADFCPWPFPCHLFLAPPPPPARQPAGGSISKKINHEQESSRNQGNGSPPE